VSQASDIGEASMLAWTPSKATRRTLAPLQSTPVTKAIWYGDGSLFEVRRRLCWPLLAVITETDTKTEDWAQDWRLRLRLRLRLRTEGGDCSDSKLQNTSVTSLFLYSQQYLLSHILHFSINSFIVAC
jgi:hypothetical protein